MLAGTPAALRAQDIDTMPVPLVEVSAGYVWMQETRSEREFPLGWSFSGGVNLTQWFGIVGEVGGSYWSEDGSYLGGTVALSQKAQVYTFLGGPRFFHKTGRVVPFAQVLAGVGNRRLQQTELRSEGPHAGMSTWSPATTSFAIQPGGGVTIYLTEGIGVRAAGDYRSVIQATDDVFNEFRFVTGFTFQWGHR